LWSPSSDLDKPFQPELGYNFPTGVLGVATQTGHFKIKNNSKRILYTISNSDHDSLACKGKSMTRPVSRGGSANGGAAQKPARRHYS
jgi:hypothetical protein